MRTCSRGASCSRRARAASPWQLTHPRNGCRRARAGLRSRVARLRRSTSRSTRRSIFSPDPRSRRRSGDRSPSGQLHGAAPRGAPSSLRRAPRTRSAEAGCASLRVSGRGRVVLPGCRRSGAAAPSGDHRPTPFPQTGAALERARNASSRGRRDKALAERARTRRQSSGRSSSPRLPEVCSSRQALPDHSWVTRSRPWTLDPRVTSSITLVRGLPAAGVGRRASWGAMEREPLNSWRTGRAVDDARRPAGFVGAEPDDLAFCPTRHGVNT